MRAGKIVALVAGILIVLMALALLVPGGVLLGIYGTQRDSDGFFTTSDRLLTSDGYALVTPDVDLHVGPAMADRLFGGDRAAIRISTTTAGDTSVFIGVGPSAQVAEFLSGVEYDEVTDLGWGAEGVDYRHLDGGAPPSAPGEQDFWVAQAEGSGTQTVEWDITEGSWTAVVMNTDASAPVSSTVKLGARFDILFPIGLGMVIGGVILLGVGILLIVLGARRPPEQAVAQAQSPYAPAGQYPPVTTPPAATPESSSKPEQPSEPPAKG